MYLKIIKMNLFTKLKETKKTNLLLPMGKEKLGEREIRKMKLTDTHCYPDGTSGKELPAHKGDTGLIPGLGRSPGGGHGNPLQSSCLESPIDRRAWWAMVHRVTKSGHD